MDTMTELAIGYRDDDRFHEEALYFIDGELVTRDEFSDAARELAPYAIPPD